jgi:uncharacterized membrane protein YdjX (TVP38/TMEM64 family)
MLESVGEWIEASGALLYLLAPAFTAVVAVLPLPAEVPAMINGMAFGPVWGSLVTWVGAMLGAQASFELARRWGRPAAERVVPLGWLDRADRTVAHAGWPALLALRLMPTVAFTAINWAAGLTSVRRTTFVWTTAVGILPGAVAFTTGGAGLLELASGSGRGALLLAIAASLLATGAAIALLWRRRASGPQA